MKSLPLVVLMVAAACGTPGRGTPDGGSVPDSGTEIDGPPNECVPSTEICGDGIDNDCDTRTDCGDSDCSGALLPSGESCEICGVVENPEANPLALPDGVSDGLACSTDAQCTDPAAPNCIVAGTQAEPVKECHASYSSTLDFIGFPDGATLDDTSKLLSVCVTMEHSYLFDLHIELISPPNAGGTRTKVALHKFIDREQDPFLLGTPNQSDSDDPAFIGTGAKYCWTMQAPNTMQAASASLTGIAPKLPAGDYKPVVPFTAFMGVPLNGTWEMRVTDMWEIDNGFMFQWSISFDPSLVEDCAGPIIE